MFDHIFPIFGLLGTGIVILVIIVSSWLYRGRQGERYSILNHFISELGELGVSRAAKLFNAGLILGGILLIPYMIGLGMHMGSLLGWIGAVMGLLACLGVAGVGIYPMNDLPPHGRAAQTYFRSGLAMVLFFGMAILIQPTSHQTIHRTAGIFSLPAFAAYTSFLILLSRRKWELGPMDGSEPQVIVDRPPLAVLAILEWAVFLTTILWLMGLTFFL